MAWAYVARVGTGTGTSTTSFTVTPTLTTIAGNCLVLCCGGGSSGSGGNCITSVADTKSNTWVILTNGSSSSFTGTAIAVCFNPVAMTTSDHLTVTMPNPGTSPVDAVLDEFSGVGTASDAAGTGTGNFSGTSLSATTSTALTGNNELCVASAGCGSSSATITASGWTVTAKKAGSSTEVTCCYKDSGATSGSTLTFSGTISASNANQSSVAVLKNAASVGGIPDVNMAV